MLVFAFLPVSVMQTEVLMKKARLKDWEIEAIKEAIKNVDKDAKIILLELPRKIV